MCSLCWQSRLHCFPCCLCGGHQVHCGELVFACGRPLASLNARLLASAFIVTSAAKRHTTCRVMVLSWSCPWIVDIFRCLNRMLHGLCRAFVNGYCRAVMVLCGVFDSRLTFEPMPATSHRAKIVDCTCACTHMCLYAAKSTVLAKVGV